MSTFREIIERVDDMKPNAFHSKTKLSWLMALDGKIAADVFLMGIGEIRALQQPFPEGMKCEPLVGFPHEDIYDWWLMAKIDAGNGEYDKYQNTMAHYNECFSNFVRWFVSSYEPARGGEPGVFVRRPDVASYYITAYGLALKQGFLGTLEEWLKSLHGEKGDPGKSAYQYALEGGYVGTEEAYAEFVAQSGKSAYQYAVEGGYKGTIADFRVKMAKEYADADHNHDAYYAPKNHNHDSVYAPLNHNHDGYASSTHKHSADDINEGTLGKERLPVVPIEKGGTGNTTGEAPSATKLATARTVRTNLASGAAASFDGSDNVTPGVTGVLPAANGGTGKTTLADALIALLASGNIVLTDKHYGDTLPAAGTKGRLFFKKVSS